MDYQEEKTMLDEAITHAREIAEKNYLQGMLCHANPDDEELDGCIECGREHEQLAKWLEELMQYKQLGTLEEVRYAVERQQAKEPSPMLGIYGRVYECKECGNELEMYSKHCPFCGQKQNWE